MTMTKRKNTHEVKLWCSPEDGHMNAQKCFPVSQSKDMRVDDRKPGTRLQKPSVPIHQHKETSETVIQGKVKKDGWKSAEIEEGSRFKEFNKRPSKDTDNAGTAKNSTDGEERAHIGREPREKQTD